MLRDVSEARLLCSPRASTEVETTVVRRVWRGRDREASRVPAIGQPGGVGCVAQQAHIHQRAGSQLPPQALLPQRARPHPSPTIGARKAQAGDRPGTLRYPSTLSPHLIPAAALALSAGQQAVHATRAVRQGAVLPGAAGPLQQQPARPAQGSGVAAAHALPAAAGPHGQPVRRGARL
jgi:hypothetical protein